LSFEDWVVRKFGKKLFSIFFKTYSEKLWGIPCDKLDADWAAQRIKKLSLFEAVKAAFLGDGKKKHKTLVDQFAYPKDGTGSLYNKMAAKIIELGGEIQFNTKVKKITEQGNLVKGVIDQSGNMYSADYIVSTMPLTEMVRGFDLAPPMVIEASEKLYFRNTTLVYLEIDSDSLFPDNWIYIHSAGVRFGRITNFRNWCPSLINGQKSTILCCEYWSFDTDEFWTWTENRIEQLVKDELAKTKLLTPAHSILNMKVIRIPKCYPVYEIGYKQHLDTIINWLSNKNNLLAIGRYGAFKYNNQDHSILMGLLAARQIRTGIKQNLWQNTNTE
jgi:protoporphyrinogen oxidase